MRIRARTALAMCALGWSAGARAQQLIGYVAVKDAEVTGAADVMDGNAVLAGSVTVRAKDRTAAIRLSRRGEVRVCQTSVLRMTESRAAEVSAPMLLALERGAVEVQMTATVNDAVMTPDLRFQALAAGPLDLRVRVGRNGDTCVDNRGGGAPTLVVSDQFGEGTYQIRGGQHVLFEHGSLREVVDREREACGCPEAGMPVAEALLSPGAAAHPFPEAVSAGLAPGAVEAPAGVTPAQAAGGLVYNAPVEGPAAAGEPTAPAPAPVQPVAARPAKDVAHVVGRFFRRLFGGG